MVPVPLPYTLQSIGKKTKKMEKKKKEELCGSNITMGAITLGSLEGEIFMRFIVYGRILNSWIPKKSIRREHCFKL